MADAYTRALGGTVSGLLGMYEDWKRQPQMAALGGLLMGDTAPAKEWLGVGKPWPKDAAQQVKQGSYNLAMDWNNPMGLIGHTVWHGSPHKFDKFDMSKIGTGEGAQAYGHGLYFAESPKVAQQYKDNLASTYIDAKGNPVASYGDAWTNAMNAAREKLSIHPDRAGMIARQVRDFVDNGGKAEDYLSKYSVSSDLVPAYQAAIEQFKNVSGNNGQLYKVDIPDEILPRMLDWDKPLHKQPMEIKKLASDHADKLANTADIHGVKGIFGLTGADLYGTLANKLGGHEKMSALLNDAGIPGIRYLDGSSRDYGSGTYNYVLFDDKLPRILERNGTPTGLLPWNN